MDAKYTPSLDRCRQACIRNLDTTDKKKSEHSNSYVLTHPDRNHSDSIYPRTNFINLEPQRLSQTFIRVSTTSRPCRVFGQNMLNRNMEYILSESNNMDQLDDLKDERASTKNLIGQSILNMQNSFTRDSVGSRGRSFYSPFGSLNSSKDKNKLQKCLADLQRDGKTHSSYCNPCTLI